MEEWKILDVAYAKIQIDEIDGNAVYTQHGWFPAPTPSAEATKEEES